jgi:hypothetical protein
MNLDFYQSLLAPFNKLSGLNKLKADDSKELLYKTLYALEAIIIENPNTTNMNSIKMLYANIKDFLVNNK